MPQVGPGPCGTGAGPAAAAAGGVATSSRDHCDRCVAFSVGVSSSKRALRLWLCSVLAATATCCCAHVRTRARRWCSGQLGLMPLLQRMWFGQDEGECPLVHSMAWGGREGRVRLRSRLSLTVCNRPCTPVPSPLSVSNSFLPTLALIVPSRVNTSARVRPACSHGLSIFKGRRQYLGHPRRLWRQQVVKVHVVWRARICCSAWPARVCGSSGRCGGRAREDLVFGAWGVGAPYPGGWLFFFSPFLFCSNQEINAGGT